MSIMRTATLNTFYQLFGKGISLVLGLYITSAISHSLSVADYGRYVLITGLVLQIAAISEWGTGFIAVRAASQKIYPHAHIFSNLLFSRLILSSVGSLFLFVASYFHIFKLPSSTLVLASLIIIPLGVKNVVSSFFQAQTNFRVISLIEVLSNLVFALTLFLYSHHQFTLNYPVFALALSTFLASLLGLFLQIRNNGLSKIYQPAIIKYLFLNAIPVGGQLLIFNIYNRLDLYMLQHFQSEIAVARYGLSYKLYETSILVAAYFMNSLFPTISSTATQSLAHLYSRSLKIMAALGLGIGLLLALCSSLLIHFINSNYTDSIPALRILSLGLAFTYINHVNGYTLTAINKQHVFMGIAFISLVTNTVLNFILIPRFSYSAAAVTTVITELTTCTISYLALRKFLKLTIK